MPNYQGHLMGATVAYLAIVQVMKVYNPSWMVILQGFVFCLLGGLFPDIDIKSKGQKIFYTIAACALALFLFLKRIDLFIALSLMSVVPLLVRHRGLFHQVWFLIFISLSVGLFVGSYNSDYSPLAMSNALFFLAGALSHVGLDRLFTWAKYRLPRS